MISINVEIKAKIKNPLTIRSMLMEKGARFIGTDHQVDTYFHVQWGRLKLRQGNIEKNLVYYERPDIAGMKQSDFQIVSCQEDEKLKNILSTALGVKIIVVKTREIYFIENVKFHLDEVIPLGYFFEIEAGNLFSDIPLEKLREQCSYYQEAFHIPDADILKGSYSDMLEQNTI